MEFVTIEGDDKPKIMYTPYIYATIQDYSNCYVVVKNRNNIRVIEKESIEKERNNGKQRKVVGKKKTTKNKSTNDEKSKIQSK